MLASRNHHAGAGGGASEDRGGLEMVFSQLLPAAAFALQVV